MACERGNGDKCWENHELLIRYYNNGPVGSNVVAVGYMLGGGGGDDFVTKKIKNKNAKSRQIGKTQSTFCVKPTVSITSKL